MTILPLSDFSDGEDKPEHHADNWIGPRRSEVYNVVSTFYNLSPYYTDSLFMIYIMYDIQSLY